MTHEEIQAALSATRAETDALRHEINAVFRTVTETQTRAEWLRADSQARRAARRAQSGRDGVAD